MAGGGAVSRLVVSVHDVAPATAAHTRRWCADLDERAVPLALLVVPGPWRVPVLRDDPEFAGWLRHRVGRGDEVVQHGWRHRMPATAHGAPRGQWRRRVHARVVARGAAEFAALTEGQAAARLVAGRVELSALGLSVEGFTPPGWLASPGTVQALRRLRFRYTTCHAGVRDLATGGWHPAFVLSHRAGGLGERAGARLMVAGARHAVRGGRDIRIALHPADLDRPGLREAALRAIDSCLDLGAAPTTYLGLLGAASRVSA